MFVNSQNGNGMHSCGGTGVRANGSEYSGDLSNSMCALFVRSFFPSREKRKRLDCVELRLAFCFFVLLNNNIMCMAREKLLLRRISIHFVIYNIGDFCVRVSRADPFGICVRLSYAILCA